MNNYQISEIVKVIFYVIIMWFEEVNERAF